MARLSARQENILTYIRAYHAEHRFMPSVRDIQEACNISSTSVVDYNLRILSRDGYIRRAPDISRGIELIGSESSSTTVVARTVPIVSSIAAGEPLPVATPDVWESEAMERVTLPPELTPRDADGLFAVRVKGQSMIDSLIDDGDLVVLRPARAASNGEMVAAWIKSREEATLKHFYSDGPYVRLQPANITMSPIIVPAEDVEVQGKVVAVLRRVR